MVKTSWSYTHTAVQAYTRKQAQCLVEIADNPDSPSLANLQRWSLEITAMFTCLTVTNPRVMDTLAVSSMDGSSQTESFSDKHYDDMLVSLSEIVDTNDGQVVYGLPADPLISLPHCSMQSFALTCTASSVDAGTVEYCWSASVAHVHKLLCINVQLNVSMVSVEAQCHDGVFAKHMSEIMHTLRAKGSHGYLA